MQVFSDRTEASEALTDHIQSRLKQELAVKERVLFVASGGKSPVQFFNLLSDRDLAWERVMVSLSDERCVPANHPESNEKLVRDHMLKNKAFVAGFISPDDNALAALMPAACTLLGMGEDGHFASLFPDSDQLKQGLTSNSQVLKVATPSSEFERISMTLPTLLNSKDIVLLVFGEKKKQVLENSQGLPIERLLKAADIKIFWAP